MKTEGRTVRKRIVVFLATFLVLAGVLLWAVNAGSISISMTDLLRGLFVEYDQRVAVIYDLRFPRILLSLMIGAALAVSGVLFQAVLKNPLTDPGIIGISGGASFATVIVTAFFPAAVHWTPLFASMGGLAAFVIVYALSWKGGLSPLRIILVGIAVSTMFTGLINGINSMSGGNQSSVAAIVAGSITMKNWEDVSVAAHYIPLGLILAFFTMGKCNLLSLDDKTVRGIGVNVTKNRLLISALAVLLASVSTAVAGVISFVGLIVPHIARILVGHDHKYLIPYSMILGALVMVFADTLGKTIAAPYEISASVVMSVVGGPFFIMLLQRRSRYGG